jgi:RNA-binding protein
VIYLQEVGEVLHIAKSGRVIVRLNQKIGVGDVLVDSKEKKVARVVELIGPVRAPYASAVPMTDRVSRYVGAKVYRSHRRSGTHRRNKR